MHKSASSSRARWSSGESPQKRRYSWNHPRLTHRTVSENKEPLAEEYPTTNDPVGTGHHEDVEPYVKETDTTAIDIKVGVHALDDAHDSKERESSDTFIALELGAT